ncbi:MAG TPA: hypothetical protein ENH84_03375 [Phycisphaerae bacterium]|nr:hypothetical protein [Phycisphaerae bacterium]
MNKEIDELESKLKSLELRSISENLRGRIARDLSASQVTPSRGGLRRYVGVMAAFTAAACVLTIVVLRQVEKEVDMSQSQIPQPVENIEHLPPTLAGYQMALRRGPEAVERLLDHHAAILLPPENELIRVCDFRKFQQNTFQNKEKQQ